MRTRLGVLIAAAVILVAACGSGGTATKTTGAVKEGGKLVFALGGDIAYTDPALISDSESSTVMNQVLQGLVGIKPGAISEVVGVLAESWKVSPDGKTYTFKIRQGVKFHDGTPLDAAAVKANYDRWKNWPADSTYASSDFSYYQGAVFGYGDKSLMEKAEAPDASTFIITLKEPRSNFLLSQTSTTFSIVSPAALKAGEADKEPAGKSPFATGGTAAMTGTGPFKFKEWVVGDHVTIVKNPDYWDKAGMAHLDEVIFKPIDDPTARLNALQSGEIDMAQQVAPIDVKTIQKDSKLAVIDRGESCNVFHIALQNQTPPFDNPKVREAIAYAVNKQALIDTFYAGQAVVADNWMPPATQFYKPLGLPKYDPEKAKALIKESGLSADKLTIEFWYPSNVTRPYMPDPKGIFEALSRDLEAVGFTVKPNSKPWRPDYVKEEQAGKYPMFLIGWTCDWGGADNVLATAFFWFDSEGKPNPELGYANAEVSKLETTALTATDEATAKDSWQKIQDIIAKDLPSVPLVSSTPPGAMQAYVKGFVPAGTLTEYLNTVWLDK